MIINILSYITGLFKRKQLCSITFVYDIKPEFSQKTSVKNATKEILAYVENGVTKEDCIKIFADNSLVSNFTYQIKEVTINPVKSVSCSK